MFRSAASAPPITSSSLGRAHRAIVCHTGGMSTKRPRRRNPSQEVSGIWPLASLWRDASPGNDAFGARTPELDSLGLLEFQLDSPARRVDASGILDGITSGSVWVFPSGDWFVWSPRSKNETLARQFGILLRRTLKPASGLPRDLARLHRGTLWVGHPARLAIDQAGGGMIPVAGGLTPIRPGRGPRRNPRRASRAKASGARKGR